MKRYAADFETTAIETYKLLGKTYVWAACLIDIDNNENAYLDTSIDAFFKRLTKESSEVYFHNLKFDGEFIISYLLSSGFIYSDKPIEKSFSTLISDNGAFYQIEVIHRVFTKRYVKTIFLDSYKKLPMSVSDIAKSFKLPIKKLEIDYLKHREENGLLTQEEIDYIINDVLIVAMALKVQFNTGLDRMTIGADALHYYKKLLGDKKRYNYLFPILDIEVDNDIRKAFKGGFTYLNPRYRGIDLHGISYDVNSLYPYVMRSKLLPYGKPQIFKGDYVYNEVYPIYIIKISCYFKVKKGFIPTIQIKNSRFFMETEYIKDSKVITDLTLTNVDWELMKEHYDISNLEIYGGYQFRASRILFDEYIDYWAEVKANSEGGQRTLAKLQLNNLYGKFATNPRRARKQPYINNEGVVEYVTTDYETSDPVYTAIGSFTTSYARDITIRAAQANIDRFIYADTDSIHLAGFEIANNIEIDSKKLGAWKNEGEFTRSKFLRAKTYIKIKEGKQYVVCAGMPAVIKESVTFDNFQYGGVYQGKLLPLRVKGGVVLDSIEFTIKNLKEG